MIAATGCAGRGGGADILDAAHCFAAAEAAGRVVVEGFMWRHHPQTVLARRLVAEGAIGRLSTIRAALSVDVPLQNNVP